MKSTLYYKQHVFVCTNKRPDGHERGCCVDRGAGAIREHLKKRCAELNIDNIRVNSAGCLDRCEQGAAVVVYPQGEWYSLNTQEDAELLAQSLAGNADASSLRV